MKWNTTLFTSVIITTFHLLHTAAGYAQAGSTEFKPSGKIWGYAFADVYYKMGGDTAAWSSRAEYSGADREVYSIGMRRLYLGYDYAISPKFSTTALLEGNDGIVTSRGDRTVFIKALNLRWKGIYPGADLVAISFIPEKVWNYRSVEKTIVDMRGTRSSSDMGIALYGKIDSSGLFGYNVMIGNGASTRPEEPTDAGKHKIYSGELYGYFLDRKIVLDVYGDFQTALNDRNVIVLKGFAAYATDPFTIGVELFSQQFQNHKSDGTNTSPLGFSVFARGSIIRDKLNAYARFDSYNPDTDFRPQDILPAYNASTMFTQYDENFFVAGLDYAAHKNVHIMPNIWVNSYSAKEEADILPERKSDLVARVTVYFIFR
jgi:hypothetical protein